MIIGTHGILKALNLEHTLKRGKFLGKGKTAPCFTLYDIGGIPSLDVGSESIEMDVWEVDEKLYKEIFLAKGGSSCLSTTLTIISMDDGTQVLAIVFVEIWEYDFED